MISFDLKAMSKTSNYHLVLVATLELSIGGEVVDRRR
jgi:hypothetical protein